MKRDQFVLALDDELIIEEFACAGGMGTGIELALGRPVDHAINHDEDACSLYRRNHPHTKVHCADVFGAEVAPKVITGNRPVALVHASPDCTDHSVAKAGQPRSKKRRALSWVLVRWAGQKRPRCLSLENVPALVRWSPLIAKRDPATGRVVKTDRTVAAPGERVPVQEQYLVPDPKRVGQTWRRFLVILREMGYEVQWWTLNAADHGAGTIRNRLFLVARCDGMPIVKPEPEFFERTRAQKREKPTAPRPTRNRPWVEAHESIDFDVASRSIFGRARPLSNATLKRVAYGMRHYVLETGDPFIVGVTQSSARRVFDIREPLRTVTTAKGGEFMVAQPTLVPLELITGFVEQANGGKNTVPAKSLQSPISTIMTKGANQRLATAHLIQLNNNCSARSLREPIRSITASGTHHALVEYELATEALAGAKRCAVFFLRQNGQDDVTEDTLPADWIELVTVEVRGHAYVITDIRLRMLLPRELAAATSFPPEYIFDHGHDGRRFSKTKQVGFIGNAVPPKLGAAVIRAQWFGNRPPLAPNDAMLEAA